MRRHRKTTPGRLVALIVIVTIVPLGVFLWLGLRLLQQDRMLEERQSRDRLQTSAELLVASLQRAVAASERALTAGKGDWPPGAVAITLRGDRISATPSGRIAYWPAVQGLRPVPREPFEDAERLEFQRGDRGGAAAAYRKLTKSADDRIRAGAVLRLARNVAATGRTAAALDTYAQLVPVTDIAEADVPLGLAASWARCTLMEKTKSSNLRSAAGQLRADLSAGRWPIGEAAYLAYKNDVDRWLGVTSETVQSERFAAALGRLWDGRSTAGGAPQRSHLTVDGQSITVLSAGGSETRILLATPDFVRSEWLEAVASVARGQDVALVLRDGANATLLPFPSRGDAVSSTTTIARAQSDLPWNVAVWSTVSPLSAGFRRRQELLVSGLALLTVLSLTASWVLARAVTRELAVARLQSDFVAAVSHEFRTPLTTLRQFTEMLRQQPAMGPERQRICVDAQARATDRLTHLVESVLDFGRMEAGARPYRFEPHDCASMLEEIVEEFRCEPQAANRRISFDRNGSVPIVADQEAFSRAIWNLLDNAVKYSPDGGPVEVHLHRSNTNALIAVRDYGLGIPAHEREGIFTKFHRGEAARIRGIRGTGIGLATVRHIISAHGGTIRVESDPGAGSTFTVAVPLKS